MTIAGLILFVIIYFIFKATFKSVAKTVNDTVPDILEQTSAVVNDSTFYLSNETGKMLAEQTEEYSETLEKYKKLYNAPEDITDFSSLSAWMRTKRKKYSA